MSMPSKSFKIYRETIRSETHVNPLPLKVQLPRTPDMNSSNKGAYAQRTIYIGKEKPEGNRHLDLDYTSKNNKIRVFGCFWCGPSLHPPPRCTGTLDAHRTAGSPPRQPNGTVFAPARGCRTCGSDNKTRVFLKAKQPFKPS